MATVKLTPSQKNMLESMANGALLIPHSYNKMVVMSLVKKNLIQATKTYSVGSDYELTDAGRAVLGIEPLPPMVDQTQPAPEVETLKVGDFVDYVDVKNRWQRGQIFEITPFGKLYIVSSIGNRHIVRLPIEVRRPE